MISRRAKLRGAYRTSTAEPSHLLVLGPSARSGGPLRYLESAVPLLAKQWPGPVTIAIPRSAVPFLGELPHDTVVVALDRPRWGRGPLHVIASQVAAWRLRRGVKPALVYNIGNIAYTGPCVPTITLIQNAARLRDLHWASSSAKVHIALTRWLIFIASIRSHRLVAASNYTAKTLPVRCRPKHATVIYHGAPVISEEAAPRQVSGPKVALSVGGLTAYRGVEAALHALARPEGVQWRLVIVGAESDRRYVERCRYLASSLGVQERVDWRGQLSQAALRSEMRRCAVILVTSRAESCPNTLLEAAAIAPHRPIIGLDMRWSDEYAALFDARIPEEEFAGSIIGWPQNSPSQVVRRRTCFLTNTTWDASISKLLDTMEEVRIRADTARGCRDGRYDGKGLG